jgi:kynurenine 3-monooxygenase
LSTSSLSRFLSALSQNSQLYDPLHQTPINSISRPLLSSTILSHAQSHANITVLFDHKVAKIDWKRRIVYRTASGFKGGWEDPSEGQNEGAGKGWDLMVGSDGIWSAVRGEMMKVSPCAAFPVLSQRSSPFCSRGSLAHSTFLLFLHRSIYSQNQIPHVWIELHLPPGPVDPSTGEATFFISPEHLHIWPRKEFMLIALPNKVRSLSVLPS